MFKKLLVASVLFLAACQTAPSYYDTDQYEEKIILDYAESFFREGHYHVTQFDYRFIDVDGGVRVEFSWDDHNNYVTDSDGETAVYKIEDGSWYMLITDSELEELIGE